MSFITSQINGNILGSSIRIKTCYKQYFILTVARGSNNFGYIAFTVNRSIVYSHNDEPFVDALFSEKPAVCNTYNLYTA